MDQGPARHPQAQGSRFAALVALLHHPWHCGGSNPPQLSRERAEQVELEDFQEAEEPSFAEEDAAAIHQALSQIGLRHREVLVLHFLEDLSIAEIAEVVGCSEGTVKSRMHYAKRAMKEILSGGIYGKAK